MDSRQQRYNFELRAKRLKTEKEKKNKFKTTTFIKINLNDIAKMHLMNSLYLLKFS